MYTVMVLTTVCTVKGRTLKGGGRLCDIATTLLPLLGLPKTSGMDGVDLFA